jgi:hypothetical protein
VQDIIDDILALSEHVRSVAVYFGGELVSRAREPARPPPDRSEEFLVHPAITTLMTQQGLRDGGGARYALLRYEHYFRLLVPINGGHVSVTVAPAGQPIMLSGPILQLTDRLRVPSAGG